MRGAAAEHLGRVLRAQAGQEYELSDGRALWLGRIERVTERAVEFVLVEELPAHDPALRTTLLLSIVKFDRFEWCLEKATELGITEIVPVAAERSDAGLVRAAPKRAARWNKILAQSAQQARRLRPAALGEAAEASKAFELFAGTGAQQAAPLRLLLSERREAPVLRATLDGARAEVVVLAIGPEGGWTEREFAAAAANGFIEVSLGGNILRTETAVIAALACVNYAFGEG